MTQTLFLSQLRALLLIVIAYCAGRGWLSPQDSGAITAILVPIGAIAGPWIWSIYANINSKLVHADSAAAKVATIEETHPVDALNAASRLAEKVAAVLIVAFAASLFLASTSAMAADKPVPALKPAVAVSTANPLQSFFDGLQKKAAAINAFTLADAQAAMVMAASDPVGLACYTAIANKLQSGSSGNLIPKSLGLLQLIEAGRLAKLQISAVQTGVDPVVQGCAGLILDANTTLLMLTGQGVIGAAGIGIGIP